MKKPYYLLLLFGVLLQNLAAQDIPVSGTITSSDDNLPLPGVTILIKGTTQGTSSNLNGRYSLLAPADAALVFSFVGMQTQEIPVNGRKIINVKRSGWWLSSGTALPVKS
jgi:hypothetical protein